MIPGTSVVRYVSPTMQELAEKMIHLRSLHEAVQRAYDHMVAAKSVEACREYINIKRDRDEFKRAMPKLRLVS